MNTFRFGWDTDRQADSFDQAELGGGLGYLDVSVGGVQLGPANYLPRVEPSETRYELSDDASLVKGNHTIKFGFNFFTTEDYNYYMSNVFGSYTLSQSDDVRPGLLAATRPASRAGLRTPRLSATPLRITGLTRWPGTSWISGRRHRG